VLWETPCGTENRYPCASDLHYNQVLLHSHCYSRTIEFPDLFSCGEICKLSILSMNMHVGTVDVPRMAFRSRNT